MPGDSVTTGASAISGLLLALEVFGGIYLLVMAAAGRGPLFDDQFVKPENLKTYRFRARIWFAVMGATMLCAGVFNLLVSMMGLQQFHSGLSISTIALVVEMIAGYIPVRKFVSKDNAPMG